LLTVNGGFNNFNASVNLTAGGHLNTVSGGYFNNPGGLTTIDGTGTLLTAGGGFNNTGDATTGSAVVFMTNGASLIVDTMNNTPFSSTFGQESRIEVNTGSTLTVQNGFTQFAAGALTRIWDSTLNVQAGGFTNNNSELTLIASTGTINGAFVQNGGVLNLYSGSTLTSTGLTNNGGSIYIDGTYDSRGGLWTNLDGSGNLTNGGSASAYTISGNFYYDGPKIASMNGVNFALNGSGIVSNDGGVTNALDQLSYFGNATLTIERVGGVNPTAGRFILISKGSVYLVTGASDSKGVQPVDYTNMSAGKGVLIGTVVDVQRDANAVTQTAFIQPTADLDRLEYVLIVTDYQGGLPPVDQQPIPCASRGTLPEGEQPCVNATAKP
jgi:hypothetical protein